MYDKPIDLIVRRDRLRVTTREIGVAIGMKPGTLSAKLCGFSPLSYDERRRILEYFDKIERQQSEALA